MTKFTDQYKDSRWQKKRLEIMERDNFACRSCGKSEDVTLNVHHAYYEKGKKVWEYPAECLVTWCDKCHKFRHKEMKDMQLHCAHMRGVEFSGLSTFAMWGFQNTLECMEPGISDVSLAACIKALQFQNDPITFEGNFAESEPEE